VHRQGEFAIRATIGAVVSLLCLSAPASAQSREFSRTAELEPSSALRVVGAFGSIRITSWEQPQVEIRARIERPDQVSDDKEPGCIKVDSAVQPPTKRHAPSRFRAGNRA
jgi:hypothetical protein